MTYLDNKDKIILENLFQDARLTTTKLAKLARITQPAAYNRLKRLENEKYIMRYDAIVNYQLLPLTKKAYLCNLNTQEVQTISKKTECVFLVQSIGQYTHHILCWFKTKKQIKTFEKLLPQKREEFEYLEVLTKGVSLFDIPVKTPKSKITKTLNLDAQDIAILKAISEGGARKTLKEISKITGLSIDLIHYRKKRIIAHGYFSYFLAQPGFGKLHLTVTYAYIKTQKQEFPNLARSPLQVKTNNGVMIAILSKDIDDQLKTLETIYDFYKTKIQTIFLLSNKKIHILNRYPFEYLL